jgi:hypothetical protein
MIPKYRDNKGKLKIKSRSEKIRDFDNFGKNQGIF